MQLTPAQKAQLAQIVKSENAAAYVRLQRVPADFAGFRGKDTDGFGSPNDPRYMFGFDIYIDNRGVPTDGLIVGFYPTDSGLAGRVGPASWLEALRLFEGWVDCIKRNVDSPSYLDVIRGPIQTDPRLDATRFSNDEINRLNDRITHLETSLVGQLDLHGAQIEALRREMAAVRAQATTGDRGGFRRTLYGAITKLMVEEGFDQVKASQIWTKAAEWLKDFFPNQQIGP